MRDFCTNIREIAKMQGLTKGAPCRSYSRTVTREERHVYSNNNHSNRNNHNGGGTTITINLGDIMSKGIKGDINININL